MTVKVNKKRVIFSFDYLVIFIFFLPITIFSIFSFDFYLLIIILFYSTNHVVLLRTYRILLQNYVFIPTLIIIRIRYNQANNARRTLVRRANTTIFSFLSFSSFPLKKLTSYTLYRGISFQSIFPFPSFLYGLPYHTDYR